MAIVAGIVYYLDSEHDYFADQKHYVATEWNAIKKKFDETTDIKIKKNVNKFEFNVPNLSDRLTRSELEFYRTITESKESFDAFKQTSCATNSHPILSKDNLRYICDLVL